MVLKAYKYRFYPTEAQKLNLAQTFGCARYVYNWGLNRRKEHYSATGKGLTYKEQSKELTELKDNPELDWLGGTDPPAKVQSGVVWPDGGRDRAVFS